MDVKNSWTTTGTVQATPLCEQSAQDRWSLLLPTMTSSSSATTSKPRSRSPVSPTGPEQSSGSLASFLRDPPSIVSLQRTCKFQDVEGPNHSACHRSVRAALASAQECPGRHACARSFQLLWQSRASYAPVKPQSNSPSAQVSQEQPSVV